MKEKFERKADRRTLYTKQAIRQAFLSELKIKDYDKITVTDLCKKAEINRSTFYLHYADAVSVFDELLAHILESMMEGLDDVVSGSGIIENVFAHSEEIYKRIMTNRTQIFLLQKGFTYPAFMDRFSSTFAEKLLPLLPERTGITREEQFFLVKSLMYSYIQMDLQCLRTHSIKELERFNALLNHYLISPCVERLKN